MTLHVLSALLNSKLIQNLNKLDSKYFLAEELGAFRYIQDYTSKYNSLPNVLTCRKEGFHLPEVYESFEYYLDNVKQRYMRLLISNALSPDNVQRFLEKDPADAIDSLEILKSSIEGVYRSKELTDIFQGADDVEEFMHRSLCGHVMGISTGSEAFDSLTHGFKGGDFVVLFARPGVGKSYMLLAFAKAVLQQGKKALFINPEMADRQVQLRFWATHMGLNTDALYQGNITTPHFQKLKEKKEEYKKLGSNMFVVNPDKRLTIPRLKSYILETRPDVIFIDSAYMLAPDPNHTKGMTSGLDKLNSTIEDIRNLAKHLDLPIVAVAQANRASANNKKTVDTTAAAGSDNWSQFSSIMLHLDKNPTNDKTLIGTLVKNRDSRTTENGQPIQLLIDNDFDHMLFGINRKLNTTDLGIDEETKEGNVSW